MRALWWVPVTDVEIRPLRPDDDMDAQVDLGQRAFGPGGPGVWERWRHVASLRIEQGTFLGAFVSGRPAGAAAFHDMRQWWHGRAVPMAGVASVKVAPEYRGQGIGRRLMTTLLELIAERGYPVSALYPATMPLYRSLGWELAGGKYEATIPARSLRSLLPPDAASGAGAAGHGAAAEVRRAGPDDAALVNAVISRAHEAARDCGPLTWDLAPTVRWLSRDDMYTYLTGDGFAAYRWDGGNSDLFVERLHGASAAAVRALWSVIASHASVARTVRARTGPADPLWWLTHERDARLTKRSMWMLRVVDAPAAIAARGFPAAVSVSVPLVINDHTRPANSGRWELTVSDGKGMLIPNGPGILPDAVAVTVGARGLAALYAGTPVATLRLAGLAAGGSPEADATLDAAFAATTFMVDDF
jgi:predicted acetyltransferase